MQDMLLYKSDMFSSKHARFQSVDLTHVQTVELL